MASTISWNSFPPSYIVDNGSLPQRVEYSGSYTTTTSSSMSIGSYESSLSYEQLQREKDFFDAIDIYVDERGVAHSKIKKVKKNKSVFNIIKALG